MRKGELNGTLVCFAYLDGRPDLFAPIIVNLTEAEYAAKLYIVRDIYGFSPGSFEFEAAGQLEAFRGCRGIAYENPIAL